MPFRRTPAHAAGAGRRSADNAASPPTEASPPEAPPTEDSPAEDSPAEASPADASPTEDSPAGASPSEAPPTEDSSAGASPPEAPPTEDSPAEDGAAKPPRRRAWRYLRRTLLVLGIVIVLVAGAVFGYAWYLDSTIHRVTVKHLANAPKGVNSGTENILMVGSTSRCALKVQNPAYGLCSEGVNGVNSDVIMILHLNPAVPSVSILSIPRDLFLPNARSSGPDKIDGALADGPSQLVKVIEEDFGIPIQHYVELNFDTFANVVDALGGINMYFPMPVYDAESGLNVPNAGCLHLNGTQALEVVRARHLQYKSFGVTSDNPADWPQETQSDLARIRRDHEFLRVLATAVAKQGLGNPITDQKIVSAVAPQLTVDSGLSASHMVNLVLTYHGVNPLTAPQLTMPVMVSTSSDYYYQGYDYGNVEFTSYPQDRQAIDTALGINANTDTYNGGALPKPGHVTVSVANGTGTYNEASNTGAALQALGFQVVGLGDAQPVGQESETTVLYTGPSDIGAAETVANSLSGAVVLEQGFTTDGAQVTVVTGSDFTVNPPPPPPSSTSSSQSGQSTTTTTTSPSQSGTVTGDTDSASSFTSTTPATSQLAPYDPRSCSPTGGAGP